MSAPPNPSSLTIQSQPESNNNDTSSPPPSPPSSNSPTGADSPLSTSQILPPVPPPTPTLPPTTQPTHLPTQRQTQPVHYKGKIYSPPVRVSDVNRATSGPYKDFHLMSSTNPPGQIVDPGEHRHAFETMMEREGGRTRKGKKEKGRKREKSEVDWDGEGGGKEGELRM